MGGALCFFDGLRKPRAFAAQFRAKCAGAAAPLALILLPLTAFSAIAQSPSPAAQSSIPAPDAAALSLVRDTSGAKVLERFIAAFPASAFAGEAKARLAALVSRSGYAAPVQSFRLPPAQPVRPQAALPPGATRGHTYIGGWRPDGVRAPGTQVVRTVPAHPAIGAGALSPQPLAKAGNQLTGGAHNYFPGYMPAPRITGSTMITAPSLYGGQVSGATAPGDRSVPAPVLAKSAAHLLLNREGDDKTLQARSEALWRQAGNTDNARVFQINADFPSMGWAIHYELRFVKQTPQEHLMTLRATLDYRGAQPAPRIGSVRVVDKCATNPHDSVGRRLIAHDLAIVIPADDECRRVLDAVAVEGWPVKTVTLKSTSQVIQ